MRYDQLIKSTEYNLQAKFDHYNALCFNNALPKIPLSFKLLKNMGGICRCKLNKVTSTLISGSISITLDKTFLRDEQSLDGILIHEMIHAWFYVQNDFSENHGMKFEAMRRKLTAQVGFPIPRTEKMENPVMADVSAQSIVVFVRYLNTGEPPVYFVTTSDYGKNRANDYVTYWQTRGSYIDDRFAAYMIASPAWSQIARVTRFQRPKELWAAKFYIVKDASLIKDLIDNGTVLFDVTKVARSS